MALTFFENTITNGIAQQPNEEYRGLEQAYIEQQWDNTTSVITTQEQKIDENGEFVLWEYDDVEAWVNSVVGESSTGHKTGSDFAQLIFADLTHDIEEGRYYIFGGYTWLSYFDNKIADVIAHLSVRRCNNHLRVRDPESGAIKSYPCVVGYEMAAASPQVSTKIITPNNHATIMVQGNAETVRLFKTNTRIILSGRPFKLYGIQNTLEERVDAAHTSMLTLEFYLDEIRSGDDLENSVAENGEYNYSITVDAEDMELAQGANGTLPYTITLNGVEVSRPVTWVSSDESVVTVDENGEYTVVGKIGDSANIVAIMTDNEDMYDSVTITVVSVESLQPKIVIDPMYEKIREGQSTTFTITALYDGEIITPDSCSIVAVNQQENIEVSIENNVVTMTCVKRGTSAIDFNVSVENANPQFTATTIYSIKPVSLLG